MTKRPMLILNGKPRRYNQFYVRLCDIWNHFTEPSGLDPSDTVEMRVNVYVVIDWQDYQNVRVSQSARPSGRRVIWVSTEVDDVPTKT